MVRTVVSLFVAQVCFDLATLLLPAFPCCSCFPSRLRFKCRPKAVVARLRRLCRLRRRTVVAWTSEEQLKPLYADDAPRRRITGALLLMIFVTCATADIASLLRRCCTVEWGVKAGILRTLIAVLDKGDAALEPFHAASDLCQLQGAGKPHGGRARAGRVGSWAASCRCAAACTTGGASVCDQLLLVACGRGPGRASARHRGGRTLGAVCPKHLRGARGSGGFLPFA